MWINWASKQFHLIDNGGNSNGGSGVCGGSSGTSSGGGGGGGNSSSASAGSTGKLAKAFEDLRGGGDLLALSLADVAKRFTSIAALNISFCTHFELLKSCREVCECYFLIKKLFNLNSLCYSLWS